MYFSLGFACLEDSPHWRYTVIFQGAEGPKGDKGEKGDTGSPCLQNNHVRSWQHKASSVMWGQVKSGCAGWSHQSHIHQCSRGEQNPAAFYRNLQMHLNGVYLLGKNSLHARHCKVTLDFALMVEILDAAVIFCSKNILGSLQFYRISASFLTYSCLLLKKKKWWWVFISFFINDMRALILFWGFCFGLVF